MSTNTNSRSAAENLLGAFLWPILPEELTCPERDAFEEAVAAQERYAAGGESRKKQAGSLAPHFSSPYAAGC